MKKLITISLAALYLVALPLSVGAQTAPAGSGTRPANLYFSPGSGNVTVNGNNQFTVTVMVNTGGDYSAGADVKVTFNTSELEFISGAYTGTFYQNSATGMSSAATANANSRISMAAVIPGPPEGESATYIKGTGAIATLVFKSKVSVGSTVNLNFDFTVGVTTDTNVTGFDTNSNPTDILGSVNPATLTIAAAANDPAITSISPTSGRADVDVTLHIYGSNFGTTQGSVYIGSRSATIISGGWANTEIVVIVPQISISSNTGEYQVKIARTDGKEATYTGYTYLANGVSNDPHITSVVPDSEEEGNDVVVSIYGYNFGSSQGSISMGALSSSIISWSDGKVVINVYGSSVDVPDEGTLYPVTLVRTDGKSSIYYGFMVTGIGFIPLFGGLFLFNGGIAYLVKRKWFTA